MNDIDLFQDGGSVICDGDLPIARLDHFVHSPGSQTGSDGIADSLWWKE